MAYVDLADIFDPQPDASPPAEWGDQIRDNFDALANPPRAKVTRTTNWTVGAGSGGSNQVIEWDGVVYDVGGFHDPISAPTRLTVPAGCGGLYAVTGFVSFAVNDTGGRLVEYWINGGATSPVNGSAKMGVTGLTTRMTVADEVELADGDYVELRVRQDSGGDLDVGGAYLLLRWVGVAAA